MRQHVNPLSWFFQIPVELPALNDLFADSMQPIHLDIGSARGDFLIGMAKKYEHWNFLGVEIRESLVNAANAEVAREGLTNIRFLFCNANISLEQWLSSLPNKVVQRVSIQFPDPWFKRRHYKRRLLQPSLLLLLSQNLICGSELFIQSDVLDIMKSMMKVIEVSSCFDCSQHIDKININDNPFPIRTEREKYAISKGLPIYRALYTRNDKTTPSLVKFIQEIIET